MAIQMTRVYRQIQPIFLTVLTVILLITGAISTASADSLANAPLFEITGSTVHTIEATPFDRSYDLYIKLPPGYGKKENQDRRYPVIYFNDAGYCWLTAVGITRAPFNFGGYEKAILVGLSYAHGENSIASRTRDLTPTNVNGPKYVTGGARAYLSFLKDDIVPFVEKKFRVDPKRRMLVGQSYGGLFGAYTLIEEPGLFHDYILTSPSLWHDDQSIFALEQKAATAGKKLSGRVYFAIGATETPAIHGGRHDMVSDQRDFAEQLRSRGYTDLIIVDEVIDGGTHLTTFPIALTRALRWLLPGDDIYGG